MADTLEPIVIPPIKVDKHFTTLGSGLLYEGQERVSADSLRSLLLPSGGRNGISDRERSKAWWGAQALFYGLKYTQSMTITQVRAQLEDALRDKNKGLRVPQNLLDLEYKHNKEFRELNAQVREKTGMNGTKRKREADAPAAPKASKSKSAAAAEPSGDGPKKKPRVKQTEEVNVVVVNVQVGTTAKPRAKPPAKKTAPAAPPPIQPPNFPDAPKPRVKQTARKTTGSKPPPMPMGGIDIDVKPLVKDPPKSRPKQTAVKTTNPGMDVDVKPRTKQTARKTVKVEDFDMPAASSSAMPAASGRPKQTARRGKPFAEPPARSAAARTDIVSGRWSIDCPFIADEWDEYDPDSFHMNIVARGSTFEAEFELGLIRGLLRCDRIEQRGANGVYAIVRWAGQENEGPVCTPSASRSGYIKFTGDRLKGKLSDVPCCGEDGVEFEGRWEGGAMQIRATWDDYDEDAYERANRARWGSRW
ncbi:hypothetical protein R3P38DRAFT_2909730 [Favolaschia claudopus]|uniref:Uncharacterized protein n=1 Tax=Favolaschia claudopus TaxID=2862362 RepID=A0AAW0C883_9AGAR